MMKYVGMAVAACTVVAGLYAGGSKMADLSYSGYNPDVSVSDRTAAAQAATELKMK